MNNLLKTIDYVTGAPSSKKLCTALKRCNDFLRYRPEYNIDFLEKFKSAMKRKADYYRLGLPVFSVSGKSLSNVRIYDDNIAYLTYAAFKIGLCTCVEELEGQICDIVDFFEKKLTKPRTDLLTTSEVIDMLDIVQNKYGLVSAVTYGRDLEIYLINKSHTCYDSFLLTFKNTYTGKWLNKWMLFSLSPCRDIFECNKYYVFLHELGHILYNAATDGGGRLPEMFREIAFFLGMQRIGDKDRPEELFADIFSVCAIHDSKYSDYNPFKGLLSEELIEMLELYFKMLSNRIDREGCGMIDGQSILH